jgi:hypothetical protein
LLLCNDGGVGTILTFAMEAMELLLDSKIAIAMEALELLCDGGRGCYYTIVVFMLLQA